ncbi:hypothetical protein FQR65_LT01741 [Abscondita terminalis]|nr:hypothetical protein FQR65_LT01741 [Abscondita terminalis]
MAYEELEKYLLNIVVTSAASTVAKTVTAPIERIKLILQNQDSQIQIIRGERQRYSGFVDCFLRIPKEQGVLSFWRGNGTNLIRYVPGQLLNFFFNDLFKRNLTNYVDCKILGFVSGACAGAVSTLAVYPLKYCQTRLSVDTGSNRVPREFYGLTDCFRKVIKTDGFLGAYKGFSVAITGSILYRGLYFGLFDSMNHCYVSYYDVEQVPFGIKFVIAQIVTNVAGFVTYPFDTVGRRLVVESGQPQSQRKLKRPWNGCKVIYVNEGFNSFYKGIRSFWRGYFPTQALNFSLNDYISKKILSKANFDQKRFVSFISGGMSGVITTLVIYPLEYCQTRISADIGSDKRDVNDKYYIKREFSGMPDCISKTSKRGGIKAFYSSIGIGTVGMSLFGLHSS